MSEVPARLPLWVTTGRNWPEIVVDALFGLLKRDLCRSPDPEVAWELVRNMVSISLAWLENGIGYHIGLDELDIT